MAITYPDGWNQIQFTLSNAVDLTKYNKITFTVEDASKPLKFGLHYWSEATGTIDLWTATAEADASGYYTFDLNPDTLTSGTSATTISIWSNGSAQTLKFHGVTFENDPNKKFESTYEVTYTAEQLTTSSSSAAYQNGAWVVAFATKDQDVTFNIPDVLNMAKCLGMTLHFSTVNGPVNFYVAKDVLAADGTRIDAMGMQGHYNLSYPALSDIEKAIRAYAEDGIDVGGITFWGVVDKYSWLQTASNVGGGSDGSLTQCPLLFDSDYKVKPAYWAFVDYSKVDPEYQEKKESVTEEPSEEKPEATPEPEAETSGEIPVDGDTAEIVEKGGLNMAAVIGICIAAVAVVAGGAVFAVRKKKKAPTGDSEIK